jgi:ribonuclease VapC
MVIDASALVAILEAEPEEERFKRAIDAAAVRLISPINLLEVHIVARRRGDFGVRQVDDLLLRARIEVGLIDGAQAALARDAFDRFGKGRHVAGLNLADCFAYALSKTSGEPLLFKGGEFAKTDVLVAA